MQATSNDSITAARSDGKDDDVTKTASTDNVAAEAAKAAEDGASVTGWTLDGFVPCNLNDDDKPDWNTLQAIESRRRRILEKVELPFWRILLSWDGTCVRALLTDWLVWIPILIFVFIRFQAYRGIEQPIFIDDDDNSINILGGFVSFLLVLFLNSTDARFQSMYQLSKGCTARIQDVAGLASSQFYSKGTDQDDKECRRLMRYMNAAHIAGYVGLDGPYSKRHFFDHFNEEYKLLNRQELSKLSIHNMDDGPVVFKVLVSWCQQVIEQSEKSGLINESQSVELQNAVMAFRSSMDGIYNYTEQPVQFFYIHFLVLVSSIYLPLFAISLGYTSNEDLDLDNFGANWEVEVLNLTFVALQSIFVVGLRLLSQNMSDPYGTDLEDLSVSTYITSGIETSNVILTAKL